MYIKQCIFKYSKPHEIIHAENFEGDIGQILNKRIIVGCFTWRFEGGESSICHIVAFESE